jgi:hypothetical protein
MLDTARPPAATAARSRAALAALGALTVLAVLSALALLLSACGYHADVPALPGGAHTLALQQVANLTDTGELDVRLRAALERRLSQQAHLRLTAPEHSALGLSVELSALTIVRRRDPAITADRSIRYTLHGQLTLSDLRSRRALIDREPLSVEVLRTYDPTVPETAAIRDEGLDDVVAAFAEAVERRIFRTF